MQHEVRRDGEPVELTPNEYKLLVTLARYPGRVYSRFELINHVQGYDFEGYERTIDAHVKNLRKKIEPDPKHPRYVETVFGVGYRLAQAMSEAPLARPAGAARDRPRRRRRARGRARDAAREPRARPAALDAARRGSSARPATGRGRRDVLPARGRVDRPAPRDVRNSARVKE